MPRKEPKMVMPFPTLSNSPSAANFACRGRLATNPSKRANSPMPSLGGPLRRRTRRKS